MLNDWRVWIVCQLGVNSLSICFQMFVDWSPTDVCFIVYQVIVMHLPIRHNLIVNCFCSSCQMFVIWFSIVCYLTFYLLPIGCRMSVQLCFFLVIYIYHVLVNWLSICVVKSMRMCWPTNMLVGDSLCANPLSVWCRLNVNYL